MKLTKWIDCYGIEVVEELARQCGGRRLYMPTSVGMAPGAMREVLGDEDAEELRESYAGDRLEIPLPGAALREHNLGISRDHVRRLIADGLSDRAIARASGMARSSVASIRRRLAS